MTDENKIPGCAHGEGCSLQECVAKRRVVVRKLRKEKDAAT